jgi:hypothetical protein
MGRIVFLLVLTAAMATPALAAKRVSVEQLEQLLAAAHGQSDGRVARQLRDLELTERASSLRLARWEADFAGRHCREALTELADASAFLDLPPSDMLANAPPDPNAQSEMLEKTVDYVTKTITRLPNFYATRKTERFEDIPSHQTVEHFNMPVSGRGIRSGAMPSVSQGESEYEPMHLAGKSSVTVSYRDGHELRGSKMIDDINAGPSLQGLTTSGEFGPILGVVLGDAIQGKLTWGYWEQGPGGVNAVFRYTVPQGQSNYMVTLPHGKQAQRIFPAYHGEIAIDPANGDIRRITTVADLAPPDEKVTSAIMVEYGSILIGGTSYICPVKSVALSRLPVATPDGGPQTSTAPMQTQLNDVAFVDYHLFRAEARVLTGVSANYEGPSAGAAAPTNGTSK